MPTTPSCSTCVGGGWLPYNDTNCYRYTTTSYTAPTLGPYPAVNITDIAYSSGPTRFYDKYFSDGTGTYTSINTPTVWENTTSFLADGPLNRCGIWTSALPNPAPTNRWLGVTTCISGLTTPKTYYIGIACNNFYRITIDGGNLLDLNNYILGTGPVQNYTNWHVYPVTIGPGDHVVEVWGLNAIGPGSFGCEIYDNSLSQLTGATNVNDLNIIFSTSGFTDFTVVQDIDGNYLPQGYSCPTGYAYSVCGGGICSLTEYCDVPNCSTCDPAYVWSGYNDDTCYSFADETAISPTTQLYTSASTNSLYSQYGTKIYSTSYLPSGLGNLMSIETDIVWKNLSMNNIDGPLNRSGIWLSGTPISAITNTWIGFSTCINGDYSGKTYYIGLGGDNHYKLVINGVEIINNYNQTAIFEPFIYWHVYPVTLYSGPNIIEVYGLTVDNADSGRTASIGCEIYDNTYLELSGATQYSDLNVVFTTSGITGVTSVQNSSGQYLTSGYSCSDGYYYSSCEGRCVKKIYCEEPAPCECLRIRIDYRDLIEATGNTINPDNTVFGVGEYLCDFTPISEQFTSAGYYCLCTTRNPPAEICFNYKTTANPPTELVFTIISGSYNSKFYYTIINLSTTIGYVWWDSTLSLWIFSSVLGSGVQYSALDNLLGPNFGDYPISSPGYVWSGESSNIGMLNSFEGPCPPSLCMTFSSSTNNEYTCTTTPSGYYNNKVYHKLLDIDCVTYIELYVYWNTSNSRWECSDTLGGATVYSVLNNPDINPISNMTYSWSGLSSTFNVLDSLSGDCSTPLLVTTPSINLYYYKNDVLTYVTYSSAESTTEDCSISSECCNDICTVSGYCISNTDNQYFDGFYINAGTYFDKPYWTGLSTNLVIYYSTTNQQWCLSTGLGGPCLLAGKTPCYSACPDFCDGIIYDGVCTTTTTLPFVDCEILDFDAIFNCHVDPTPTQTPSMTPTPTPTKNSPIPSCVIEVDADIMTYSPTPTPTPTMTPTSSGIINRNCGFNGSATFNTINDTLGCPTSRQFQDCQTGVIYYTSNSVLTPSNLSLVESMVYSATINGSDKCLIYLGKNENSSGNSSIVITSESFGSTTSGGCSTCESLL